MRTLACVWDVRQVWAGGLHVGLWERVEAPPPFPPIQSELDRFTKADILRAAATCLLRAGIARPGSLQYILHARVPIIKFLDAHMGVEVDICIGWVWRSTSVLGGCGGLYMHWVGVEVDVCVEWAWRSTCALSGMEVDVCIGWAWCLSPC